VLRARDLSQLERPKLVKEREDDASQLNRLRFYRGRRDQRVVTAFKAPNHCTLNRQPVWPIADGSLLSARALARACPE